MCSSGTAHRPEWSRHKSGGPSRRSSGSESMPGFTSARSASRNVLPFSSDSTAASFSLFALHQLGDTPAGSLFRGWVHASPCPGVQSFSCGGNGAIDVFLGGVRHGGEQFARCRVSDVDGKAHEPSTACPLMKWRGDGRNCLASVAFIRFSCWDSDGLARPLGAAELPPHAEPVNQDQDSDAPARVFPASAFGGMMSTKQMKIA